MVCLVGDRKAELDAGPRKQAQAIGDMLYQPLFADFFQNFVW